VGDNEIMAKGNSGAGTSVVVGAAVVVTPETDKPEAPSGDPQAAPKNIKAAKTTECWTSRQD